MKILVCGGRDFTDQKLLVITLDNLATEYNLWAPPDEFGNTLPLGMYIIAGGAKGADALAIDYAVVNWIPFKVYKANWKKYGRAAGAIRNQQMLEEGKPDLVAAFPGNKGTADMVERAEKAGIQVIKVSPHGEIGSRASLKSS